MQSKRFSVAIHILVALTLRKQRLSSEQLAWSIGTNPSMVRRILGMLTKAGLVSSHSGPAGGADLARDPRKVDLLQVLRAVELRPSTGVHSPNPKCPLGAVLAQPLGKVLQGAERASEEVLAQTTVHAVAQMARRRIVGAKTDIAER